MADLNESLRSAAAKPTRDAPLAAIETRLRRRRLVRKAAVGVCAIALVGALGGGIAVSSDDGPTVRTVPPAAAQANEATGGNPPISVVLPEGWVESPPEPGSSAPGFALTVGTALQPTGAPASAPCAPGAEYRDDVFVLIREVTHVELLSRQLNPEEAISSVAKIPYPERPVDFTVAPRVESTFSDGDPAGACPVLGFRFQDGGRMFEVDVGSGPDTVPERLTEAYAVLNSLVVTPITAEPEPVTTTVPTGTAPESTDTVAIALAFETWIASKPPNFDGVDAVIEDWASIEETAQIAAELVGNPQCYTGQVDAITRIDEDDAEVIFTFLCNGRPASIINEAGRAVKINGVWKVSRETVCAAYAVGGTQCPPRE